MIGLYDGMLVTMNEQRDILKNSALIIENHRILDIGTTEAMRSKYPEDAVEWISCKGRVLFPGFINSHIHTSQSIVRGVAEDMGRAPSYTSSVPQGDDLSDEESYIFSLLGAAGAMRFGSTFISDNYAHGMVNSKAFKTLGIRAMVSERVHDMDFHGLGRKEYRKDEALGEELLNKNIELLETLGTDRDNLVTACLGPHAPDTCSKELLLKIRDLTDKYPVPITTHLAQSQMELDYVKAVYNRSSVEYLDECGLLNDKLLAAHGVFLKEEDMKHLADKGVHLIHIPEGNAKAGAIAAIGKMSGMGINVAIGTDNGAANIIENMRMALVSGRIYNHSITEPNPEKILEMVTINAAKALGMEKEIGSLEAGKKADIVIVNYNQFHLTPCTNVVGNLVHLALGSDVETVYIDGKRTVENGHVLGLDEGKLMEEARQIAERKWQKANPALNKKYMRRIFRMKISLLEPIGVPQGVLDDLSKGLKDKGHEFTSYDTKTTDVEELKKRTEGCDIVMIANNPYPAEVVEAADKLKMISVAFTGIDHIGTAACKDKDIMICNAAGYSNQTVAELVIGMAIDGLRNIAKANDVVRNGGTSAGIGGREICGRTVGIIGLGKIGMVAAKLFQAFGAKVIAYNRSQSEEAKALGIEYKSLDEVLSQSDIISLNMPLNDSTRGFISAEKIALMKSDAVFINCARGPIVDNAALAKALNEDKLGFACVDVFDMEPPIPADYPLLSAKNTLLTPHQAFISEESMVRRAKIVFDNVYAYLDGAPVNVCK